MKSTTKLFLSVLIPAAIGFSSSFFTAQSVFVWYNTLNKPSFNPPNWIFGPAWMILYIMMGVSFYLVWRKSTLAENKSAFAVYFLQLALNFLWSYLFFGLQNLRWGFIEISILWFFIGLNIILFSKISRPAAFLLIPYLVWVGFASILNYSIMLLNPA